MIEWTPSTSIESEAPDEDPFEPRQIVAARKRLAPLGVETVFPGGHLTTSEQPELLAHAIRGLARVHGVATRAAHPRPHASDPHPLL